MFLEISNLSKQYHLRNSVVDALKDVSFSVKEGSFVTITGPSGSGKTTLLLAMSGLIRATSGKIQFKDQSLEKAKDRELAYFRRNEVGFIMQNFSLIPYLSAIRNVMIPLALQKISADKQVALATAVMEMVGLEDRLYHLPRELSAGQQQRVAIARAIVNKPSIIFADEPTGNLDPVLAIEILDFLRDINRQKGITIIMVTHSPLANGYGTIRIHLKEGRVETYSEAAG